MKRILVGGAFIGEDMEYARNVLIEIEDGVITRVEPGTPGCRRCIDKTGLAASPALVNAHMHLLDSAFPEAGINLSLRDAVAPGGLKHRLLASTPRSRLIEAARRTLRYMLSAGIGTVGDFREGGVEGCRMGVKASRGVGISYVPLCRPSSDLRDLREVITEAMGLGLPSPLAYTEEQLEIIGREARRQGRLIHIHASEDPEDHEAGDYEVAVKILGADVLVHATWLSDEEVKWIKGRVRGIVLCPRSNAWWGVGQPRLASMLEEGLMVALGTDNAAWVKPDMWREMEAAFHLARMQRRGFSDASAILRAATVNGARLLGLEDRGVLREGFRADMVLLGIRALGLDHSENPVATLVKRGGPEAVAEVYVGGRLVYSAEPIS